MGKGGKLVLAAAAILLAVSGGYALFHRVAPLIEEKKKAAEPVAVREDPNEVSVSGEIFAETVIEVPAPVTGFISMFMADVGEQVYEGQVLARLTSQGLESEQEQMQREAELAQDRMNAAESALLAGRLEASRARAAANQARSERDRLESDYRRQEMLYREGATPKLKYDKAEQEFQVADKQYSGMDEVAKRAEARVDGLTKDMDAARQVAQEKTGDLEDVKVRVGAAEVPSPVSGLVVGRKGALGQEIGPDQRDFFQIVSDLSHLEVRLEPEPPVLAKIKPGQPASILIEGGDMPAASVKSVDKATGVVVVPFANPNPAIRPGMHALVRIRIK
jgi:multidrug resistance efflux pump